MKTIYEHVLWWARKKGLLDMGVPEEEVMESLARVMLEIVNKKKKEKKKEPYDWRNDYATLKEFNDDYKDYGK